MISNYDFLLEDMNYENLLNEVTMRKIKIELILLKKDLYKKQKCLSRSWNKFFRRIKNGETRERKYGKYSYYKIFIFL